MIIPMLSTCWESIRLPTPRCGHSPSSMHKGIRPRSAPSTPSRTPSCLPMSWRKCCTRRSDRTCRLNIGDRIQPVRVVAIANITGPFRSQLEDLVICDLSTAQELAKCVGQIDRVDLRLSAGQEAAVAAALPAGLALRSVSDRANQLEELIAAYKLNLNALSLMASFVAIFIVYNAMLVSVQQRIKTLAVLRCLGSSRIQLAMIYLIEAIAFSAAGAVLGILGGWRCARQ